MSSSRVGVAIEALYARAVVVAADTAQVVDGTVPSGDSLQQAIIIGWDGLPAASGGDGSATSEWTQTVAGLGNHRRDETFTIPCCALSWTGDDAADHASVKARRDEAFALLALIENDLRADPSMGVSPQPFEAEVSTAQLFQETGPFGRQARIPFTVLVKHNRI